MAVCNAHSIEPAIAAEPQILSIHVSIDCPNASRPGGFATG